MKHFKTSLLLLVLAPAILFSCSKDQVIDDTDNPDVVVPGETNTKDTSFANAVVIKFNGSTATVTNPFSAAGVTVTVTNADVIVNAVITNSTEINYVLSGTTTNGSFKLYSDYKFNLVMNGVSLLNTDGPAINIQSGKKVTVNVLSGTNNYLTDGATYATSTEDQKGTFFSEGQLNFTGTGNLTVTGKYKHAICSDDYINIESGNITVAASVSDGIHSKDYFKMTGGTVKITSGSDGIDCDEGYVQIDGGTITVTSVDDGITASYDDGATDITPYIKISGGTLNITTSGEKGNALKSESYTTINSATAITLKTTGQGAKGIKTGGDITITNALLDITTTGNAFYDTDDADIAAPAGINCDGNFVMTAGTVTINSSGKAGKGITVDGTADVNGGTLNITATGADFTYGTNSSEAKGFKSDGAMTISNGTINVAAKDDGIKSETSITISNGTIKITQSTEGIEAPYITISGGNHNIVSSDDCLNSTFGTGGERNDNSLLTISGGTTVVSTTGGDGMDSNGNITITGGTIIVHGPPSAPEVGLDYNGTCLISGGLLIVSGPNSNSNMIQAPGTASAQYSVLVKLNSSLSAGQLFNIQDASGTSLVSFAPLRAAYYFVFSSSALQQGSTYRVFTGGSVSGGSNNNGYYTGGTYSGGTQRGSFTVSSKVTSVTM